MTWLPAPDPRCTDCGRALTMAGTCIDCLAPMHREELELTMAGKGRKGLKQ